MKNVMAQILASLETNPSAGEGIRHKAAWLRFVSGGDLPVSVKALCEAIRQVVRLPANAPRGERILRLHVRSRFTLYGDGHVHRPEEALERLVVISNAPDLYNQVPIRGGKESLDLLRLTADGCMECIELKPWRSGDNPLYALLELLKNLEIIRLLDRQGVGPRLPGSNAQVDARKTALTLLAPLDYYQAYGLLDSNGRSKPDAISRVGSLLGDLSRAFDVPIAFQGLGYSMEEFQSVCQSLLPQRDGHGKADVRDLPPVPALQHERWLSVAAS